MKNPSPRCNWHSASGFSKARLLLVVLLLIMVAAAVFYKLQRDALERMQQARVERVAQAQLALRVDVQRCLSQVEFDLEKEELVAATRQLRRASILDVTSEFSVELHALKLRIAQAEEAITRREKLAEIESSVLVSLKAERLDDVSVLLQQYQEVGDQDSTYLTLNEHYKEALQRKQKMEQRAKSFTKALAAWDEPQATQCLNDLRELGVKPERVAEMTRRLDEFRDSETIVITVVQMFESHDSGKYSAHLLEQLESAIERLGEHPKLIQLNKKLLSYPQIIRVPADVSSVDEAYALLRKGGVIELGEGVFYVELKINKPVVIKGTGVGVTILESRTVNGAGLHFSHSEQESKVSHLTLRGFVGDAGKHPLLLLGGGSLELSYVEIAGSANHGMAISEGMAKVANCKFMANHWDGLAVFGTSSEAHVKASNFQQNGDHGIDVWGGSKALIESSRVEKNAKSGVVVAGAKSLVTLTEVYSRANRECGIYINQGASLVAERVKVSGNRFSGLVAQGIHILDWLKSDASSNGEYGYLIDRQSMPIFEGRFSGSDNKLGLKSQKRLK